MRKEEFQVLVKAMKAVWSDPKFIPDQYAFDLWYMMLKDLPYEAANAAIHEYMLTERFAPTIADIRQKATKMLSANILDSGEAWQQARNAVHKYGYVQPDKALESLDEVTAEAVRRIGYQTICDSPAEDISIVRAQFMRIYDQVVAKRKEDRTLPETLRQKIKQINQDALMVNIQNLLEG